MKINQYLDIFVEESKEHLQELNTSLLILEKDPANTSVLNEIFRVAHTLKGMAGIMGFNLMATLTHHMEDVLDGLRKGQVKVTTEVVDVLFQCLDALEDYVENIMQTNSEGEKEYKEITEFLEQISNIRKSTEVSGKPQISKAAGQKPNIDGEGFRLNYNIYDKNVMEKAFEESLNAFEIYIELDKRCLLKAARAFIIFQILETHSEIMKSFPVVEDIEDEKFDYYFTVMIISKESAEFFIKELNSVSEVRDVQVKQITEESIKGMVLSSDDDTNQSKENNIKHKANKTPKTDATEKKKISSKTVRVEIDRLDVLMNLVSELIIIKTRLDDITTDYRSKDYDQTVENLERVTTSMHDAVMKVRMVPIESVFNRFPRMVRDISKELNKEINLNMSGEDTELDRTVIDEIGDPLIHIIRNSADHGIETPEERISKGKEPTGNIWLRAFHDGNNVVIEVEDDGKGIDINRVRKKILDSGFESEESINGLSNEEIIQYLFEPSFSTSDKITDISGRGVGLDVVKTKIEALGGNVELISNYDRGSRTIVRIPLTLAIIQALLVMVGDEKYAIPLSSIFEIYNITPKDIQFVRNQEVTLLRDTVIPIIRLHNILDIEAEEDMENKQLTCVVVRKGDKLSGLIVDSLIGQQEIVIKSLGKLLAGVRFIAGATILGDGNVALILDINSIV
ncbi:MAG: chemotaxis protein CheA [Clostridiaceae bacterium]|jgi:two-component system chemotaxis sensor kinase CheA|nr:chemotaxis protein CheA [Clostridiaceae bacterium]